MGNLHPVELDFLDNAPVRVRQTAIIDASPDAVFATIAADPSGWGQWCPGFTSASRWVSEAPHGVGNTRLMHAFGTTFSETVLAWDVNSRFAFRIDETGMPLLKAFVEDWTFSAVEGREPVRTQATWTMAVDAYAPSAVMRLWLTAQIKIMMRISGRRMAKLIAQTTGPSSG